MTNHIIRLIILIGLGFYLTNQIYQLRFDNYEEDILIEKGIIICLYWFWTIYKNATSKKGILLKKSLIPILIGLVFIALILGIHHQNQTIFFKPSLIIAKSNNEYVKNELDLKTDHTFIYSSTFLNLTKFEYGTYRINNNVIKLSIDDVEGFYLRDNLKIQIDSVSKHGNKGNIIYQIGDDKSILKESLYFKIIEDNRN